MTTGPLVSVVTPTRNMGDRLPRCVEAVAGQTWRNIEHIVVDALSTDGTIDYLRAQPHVVWISEPDTGQSNAINKGFALAHGTIVTWIAADDVLAPNAAELAVEALDANPSAGWAYGDLAIMTSRGRRIVHSPPELSLDTLGRGNVLFQPGTFFTRKALEEVGGIDEDYHLAMDFELWLRFLENGYPGVHVPHVMATFEIHEGSKTGSEASFDFVWEEARALRKHARLHDAGRVIDRWYWNSVISEAGLLLEARRYGEARRLARDSLLRRHAVVDRVRLFLWAVQWAPSIARQALRLRRHPPIS